jgi:hypothetical protein
MVCFASIAFSLFARVWRGQEWADRSGGRAPYHIFLRVCPGTSKRYRYSGDRIEQERNDEQGQAVVWNSIGVLPFFPSLLMDLDSTIRYAILSKYVSIGGLCCESHTPFYHRHSLAHRLPEHICCRRLQAELVLDGKDTREQRVQALRPAVRGLDYGSSPDCAARVLSSSWTRVALGAASGRSCQEGSPSRLWW